jgi:hypothetical protein
MKNLLRILWQLVRRIRRRHYCKRFEPTKRRRVF